MFDRRANNQAKELSQLKNITYNNMFQTHYKDEPISSPVGLGTDDKLTDSLLQSLFYLC